MEFVRSTIFKKSGLVLWWHFIHISLPHVRNKILPESFVETDPDGFIADFMDDSLIFRTLGSALLYDDVVALKDRWTVLGKARNNQI